LPDVILMQMERHPLNRPRFYRPVPVVFDIDDADFLWEHARPLVQECCQDSAAVVAGSRFVAEWAAQWNPRVEIVWTGAPHRPRPRTPSQLHRRLVVAWGHSRPHDYPQEEAFLEAVLLQVAKRISFEYWIFGVRDEFAKELRTERLVGAGIKVRSFPPMPFAEFSRRLEEVAVGMQVLAEDNPFSRGKSFGKILNYLEAGAVVLATSGADHAGFFRSRQNGVLAKSQEEWSEALVWLLENPSVRARLAKQAYTDFLDRLTSRAAARRYDALLRAIMHARAVASS